MVKMLTNEEFTKLSVEEAEVYLRQFKTQLKRVKEKFDELADRLKACVHKFDIDDLGAIKDDPEYIKITKEIEKLNEEAVSIMFK